MIKEICLNIIPHIILGICFVTVIYTGIKDLIHSHKIVKLYKEYSSLINSFIESDYVGYSMKMLNDIQDSQIRMGKINKHNKKSIAEVREIITDLELILAPNISDVAIKVRQRNIKSIIS